MEAIFGLVGVVLGAALTWFHDWRAERKTSERDARYLAIRVVCVLDAFAETCAEVAADDGLSFGQLNRDGCLEPQVERPPAPSFPDDLNWKSIEHSLMYRILSFPREFEVAERMVHGAWVYADPPNYEGGFEEQANQYSKLGLSASALADELRRKYQIVAPAKLDWDPLETLLRVSREVEDTRTKRAAQMALLPDPLPADGV